jgi:hypothetical protein
LNLNLRCARLCRVRFSKSFWLRCPSDNSSSDMVLPAPRQLAPSMAHTPDLRHPSLLSSSLELSTTLPTKPSSTQTPLSRVSSPPRATRDTSFQQAGRVSISRPRRSLKDGEDTARFKKRCRVNHACEPCRERKSKCSAERLVCKHCHDSKIACFYTDGKRDRVKK